MGTDISTPKTRQLTAEEITQAETHSLKSLNKSLSGRPIIAQSESPAYYIGEFIDALLLPIVNKQNTYMGHPALHTTDQITPGSSECTLIAYDCTSIYINMGFTLL